MHYIGESSTAWSGDDRRRRVISRKDSPVQGRKRCATFLIFFRREKQEVLNGDPCCGRGKGGRTATVPQTSAM